MHGIGTARLLAYTADIVAAHLRSTPTTPGEVAPLIRTVHSALVNAGRPPRAATQTETATPQTIFPDYLVCLEDGRHMKTLKRHLSATYGLTPEQYRQKWHLPPDYPMVAPAYAETRSTLARTIGLGRKAAAPAAAPSETPPKPRTPAPTIRPFEVVTPPPAPPPAEPTARSVFANFPQDAEPAPATPPAADEDGAPAQRRTTRTPFAKQLARSMRR